MLKIREAIVVEGRYDKNTLSQVVDTVILETAGFGIFRDEETLALLRRIGAKRGLILLTAALGDRFLSRVRKSTGFLRRLPASLPYVPGPFPGQGLLLSPAAFPGRTFSLDLRSKGRRGPPSRLPKRHSYLDGPGPPVH